MPIWTDDYLNHEMGMTEEEIARNINCIFRREALDIVAGTATYNLPTNYTNIFTVSWKGKQLDPLTQYVIKNLDATYLTNQSTPQWFSSDLDGPGTIRFYPVPNETIATITTNLYGTEIANRVIVGYFMSPDPDNLVFSLPRWITRRLIKAGVLAAAFKIEGKGQNLRLAEYYQKKYDFMLEQFKLMNTKIHETHRRPSRDPGLNPRLMRPQWPANFGIPREGDY